jgi:hypothetical protein
MHNKANQADHPKLRFGIPRWHSVAVNFAALNDVAPFTVAPHPQSWCDTSRVENHHSR